jgi:hypothetical protein
MRAKSILLSGLLAACASAPPPAKPTRPSLAVAAPTPTAEKEAPPEPLETEAVELKLDNGFLSFGLGSIRSGLWSRDELVKRLPGAAKRELDALQRAREASNKARRNESMAAFAFYRCEGCRERAQLERKHQVAAKASVKARDALDKATEHAERALERQLRLASATPEIGVALFRLRSVGASLEPTERRWVTYGTEGGELAATDALERAVELAGPDQEAGRRARRELLDALWRKADAERARQLITELAPSAPPEERAELELRSALFDALDGHDAKAADGFERALAAHVPGSAVSRATLARAVLVARYRALDFERVLPAALRAFDEVDRPEPPPPPPPKPPPPKPPPASKKQTQSAKAAALSQAVEFGMLGLLSTSSLGDPELDEGGIARLAADSVERTGRDPAGLGGSAKARALILGTLATRALYRNDTEGARRLAEASRALGAMAETRGALEVLEALAFREDDPRRATELEKERGKLPYARHGSWLGTDAEPDQRDLADGLRNARGEQRAGDEGEAEPEKPAAHNVRSVLRSCIEPVRTDLPQATGDGKQRRIATLTIDAKVFPDGRVEMDASADRSDAAVSKVLDCLKATGPKLMAHAPSSVSARVTLGESVRSVSSGVLGSLWGDSIGEVQGFGGLGLRGVGRGGGGTGEGIGLGSIGTRGRGSGSGYGSGAGRLGGTKPKSTKPKTSK